MIKCQQEAVPISDNTSDRRISQSIETTRFVFRIILPLSNLADILSALLPRHLPNFKAIRQFQFFNLASSMLRVILRYETSSRILIRTRTRYVQLWLTVMIPDSKVHGANMGPSGADKTQVGPMLAPQTLLSGMYGQTSNMKRIKSQNLYVSRVVLQLSLPN